MKDKREALKSYLKSVTAEELEKNGWNHSNADKICHFNDGRVAEIKDPNKLLDTEQLFVVSALMAKKAKELNYPFDKDWFEYSYIYTKDVKFPNWPENTPAINSAEYLIDLFSKNDEKSREMQGYFLEHFSFFEYEKAYRVDIEYATEAFYSKYYQTEDRDDAYAKKIIDRMEEWGYDDAEKWNSFQDEVFLLFNVHMIKNIWHSGALDFHKEEFIDNSVYAFVRHWTLSDPEISEIKNPKELLKKILSEEHAKEFLNRVDKYEKFYNSYFEHLQVRDEKPIIWSEYLKRTRFGNLSELYFWAEDDYNLEKNQARLINHYKNIEDNLAKMSKEYIEKINQMSLPEIKKELSINKNYDQIKDILEKRANELILEKVKETKKEIENCNLQPKVSEKNNLK